MMTPDSKPFYLYLHVPFCSHICFYCDFCHAVYQKKLCEKWLNALEKEIRQKEINPHLRTIYIGGGTPTSLYEEQLEQLLCLLKSFSSETEEYTIEINPETLNEKKAVLLNEYHINRASIGLQSSDPGLLKMMGRRHDFQDVKNAASLLRKNGIDNISLDIMYSLPGQTMEQLQKTIDDALSLEPSHLSLYSLTIEEGTVFKQKGYTPLDEDTEADMYEYICGTLPRYGFVQYETANFARKGKESIHNSAYWNYRDFYGIGCGASGKEGDRRYDNTRSLEKYIHDPLLHEDIPLSKQDQMFEMVMMGMRLKKGMNLNLFQKTFGIAFQEAFGEKAEKLYQNGSIENKDGCVRAKGHAYEILNTILEELM